MCLLKRVMGVDIYSRFFFFFFFSFMVPVANTSNLCGESALLTNSCLVGNDYYFGV